MSTTPTAFVIEVAINQDGLAAMKHAQRQPKSVPARSLDSALDAEVCQQLLQALRRGRWDGLVPVVRPLPWRAYEGVYQWLCGHVLLVCPFARREQAERAVTLISEHAYRHFHTQDAEINFAALCFRLSSLQCQVARGGDKDDWEKALSPALTAAEIY